ncbi:MAG: prepilin-type N-terminal cleavage/methylation domain-containing protein [Candidatus Omnitrophica bacterium]|nr:prepilin-type N-terminal cleavage/methylation domain-containing protein [Candidatus Omnitrophota bacterium]
MHNSKGFTLVEIMIVVAIIGLLAAIAIPNFVSARATAATNACLANLRQMDSAIQMFQIDTGGWPTATGWSTELATYLRNVPTTCPGSSSTSYSYNAASGTVPAYASCGTHGNVAGVTPSS